MHKTAKLILAITYKQSSHTYLSSKESSSKFIKKENITELVLSYFSN